MTTTTDSEPNLHIYAQDEDLIHSVCDLISIRSVEAIRDRGRFLLCLSGGSTPKPIYERLATDPYRKWLDWKHIHVFWGDERCVPPDHPDSNYGMTKAALLDKVDILPVHVHSIDGAIEPAKAANKYEKLLVDVIGDSRLTFDLTLLGLGDDGHTASLFPGTSILKPTSRLAASVYLKSKDVYRISLTAPTINRSRQIVFVVKGSGKQHALREVISGDNDHALYPAQLIGHGESQVDWMVDRDAAELLLR